MADHPHADVVLGDVPDHIVYAIRSLTGRRRITHNENGSFVPGGDAGWMKPLLPIRPVHVAAKVGCRACEHSVGDEAKSNSEEGA